MRVNENTVICGDKIILVPYRPEHVPTYHEWMKSPSLLELTASEPLNYEEELEMQQKWHLDEDKLTFILLERPSSLPSSSKPILNPDEVKSCRMVGDVNMFLPNGLEEDGECEMMIADPDDRRKGYALEALTLFLGYAVPTLHLTPTNLIAKIGSANKPSIRLFEKLGFGIVKYARVWDEVELRWGHPPKAVEEGMHEDFVPLDWDESEKKRKDGEWTMPFPKGRIGVYDLEHSTVPSGAGP